MARRREIHFPSENKALKKHLDKDEKKSEIKKEVEKKRIIKEDEKTKFVGFFGKQAYKKSNMLMKTPNTEVFDVCGFGIDYPGESIYIALINAIWNKIEKYKMSISGEISSIYFDIYEKIQNAKKINVDDEQRKVIIHTFFEFLKISQPTKNFVFLISMMQYEIEYENILRLDAIGSSNITFALVSLQPLSTQINSLDNNAKNKKEFERFFSEENIFETDLN